MFNVKILRGGKYSVITNLVNFLIYDLFKLAVQIFETQSVPQNYTKKYANCKGSTKITIIEVEVFT
jgi:hypothetical protein